MRHLVFRQAPFTRPWRTPSNHVPRHRTLIAAPKPGSAPVMERRSDRELPSIKSSRPWLKTMPVFVAIITVSALGIFNYEKSSSSVVNSTLYSLRTHPRAREILGDQIYFKHKIPWIWGELNLMKGRINISYAVKGTKDSGMLRFRSIRRSRLTTVSFFCPRRMM